MKRFAVPLVIGASLAILVALLLLLRSITSTAPVVPVTATRPDHTESVRAPLGHTAPGPSAPGPAAPSVPTTRTAPVPSLPSIWDTAPVTPAGSGDAPPGTKFNTKNLQYGLPQLRDKIAANAPHIAACLAGTKVTGAATVTFIVAQRADKIIVEQTDIDHDKSTIQDESVLDCLSKAALQIQFDGLPREAPAIYVTRGVTVQDGAVTEDRPITFSYIR